MIHRKISAIKILLIILIFNTLSACSKEESEYYSKEENEIKIIGEEMKNIQLNIRKSLMESQEYHEELIEIMKHENSQKKEQEPSKEETFNQKKIIDRKILLSEKIKNINEKYKTNELSKKSENLNIKLYDEMFQYFSKIISANDFCKIQSKEADEFYNLTIKVISNARTIEKATKKFISGKPYSPDELQEISDAEREVAIIATSKNKESHLNQLNGMKNFKCENQHDYYLKSTPKLRDYISKQNYLIEKKLVSEK